MGFFDDDEFEALLAESNQFKPQDLNEGNVQAIFNRCLATEHSQEQAVGFLFPPTRGYKEGTEKLIYFDKEALLKNKKSIEYLFGQIQEVHVLQKEKRVNIDDYNTTYMGEHWTRDKATLLKLLYLGVTSETLVISPFRAEDDTSLISPRIRPTLSPKDPAFPAWWEAHKSEWEA